MCGYTRSRRGFFKYTYYEITLPLICLNIIRYHPLRGKGH